jgi:sulfide dehydrogenase cytochrome subunit
MHPVLASTAIPLVAVFWVTLALAQSVQPAGLVGACSACHGADLKGSGAVPPLTGHDAEYIKKALTEFRAGQRPATVMTQLMRGFSGADIEAIAEQIDAMK